MIQHKIASLVGEVQRDGKIIFGYRTACGANIISLVKMQPGQAAVTGKPPHAHCARCYASELETTEIELPDGSLSGGVFDEEGRQLKAVREQEDRVVRSAREREDLGTPGKDPLGAYDNRPWG